jgi:hypothetical protein
MRRWPPVMTDPDSSRRIGRPVPPARAVLDAVPGDPAELPDRLCRALAGALGVDGAAISTLTDTSLRQQLGSSDELADLIETVQFSVGEGPCVQAAAGGEPVIVADLHAEAGARWPGFADLAAQQLEAVGAVFGFALTVEGTTFGSVDLYSRTRRGLSPAQIADTADAIAIAAAVLLATPHATTNSLPDESWEALTTTDPWRCMHLAIGITAGLLEIPPSQALAHLRAYAFANDMLLPELATQILSDHIDPSELNR